jgi:hypothetical protein
VAGYVEPPNSSAFSYPVAYIGQNGQYAELNSLLTSNPNGYDFQQAWLGDDGTIYADYIIPSISPQQYLAILQPVPEPHGCVALGLVALGLFVRRRRVAHAG